MKLNLGAGAHPLKDFLNLDATYDPPWRFEMGLPMCEDMTVAGISVSHALMHVDLADWPFVFSEFARVLEPGGVIRLTEDSTDDPKSERLGGFDGAVTLTSYALVRDHLLRVGLTPKPMPSGASSFSDDSLIQQWHGSPPKVFHIEGIKR